MKLHHQTQTNKLNIHSYYNKTDGHRPSLGGGHMYNRTLNALMYMVVADNLPISTCEKRGYKYYASVINQNVR